jgi:Anion-transporting ATPase
MLNDLLSHRVVWLLGKGGVGKTTISAALATFAASRGARTLVMECDTRAPLAAGFGLKASFEATEVAPRLATMVLDGRHALEEYLQIVVPGRAILRAVFASRIYQFFVQAAPGLRELMMLGKIYYEAERRPARRAHWDLIVVDAPASGQALSMLRMPTAARETFGDAIVGHEAQNIARMLRDRAVTAIAEVTTGDSLAVAEVLEMHAALAHMHLAPCALFFNRLTAVGFDSADAGYLARFANPEHGFTHGAHLADIARAELMQHSRAARALARVRDETGLPVLTLGEHRGLCGRALIDALASTFRSLNDHSVRQASARE